VWRLAAMRSSHGRFGQTAGLPNAMRQEQLLPGRVVRRAERECSLFEKVE